MSSLAMPARATEKAMVVPSHDGFGCAECSAVTSGAQRGVVMTTGPYRSSWPRLGAVRLGVFDLAGAYFARLTTPKGSAGERVVVLR
jgi:hypothetical protein